MLNLYHKQNSVALKLCFVAITTMSASGCLHAFGLARPSISPRASLDIYNDSTVRAQDGELPNSWAALSDKAASLQAFDSNEANRQQRPASHSSGHADFPVDGDIDTNPMSPSEFAGSHSISTPPRARLLPPQFGVLSQPVLIEQSRIQSLNTQTATASKPGEQSLSFSAVQVRAHMNSQSRSDMSQGMVLPDQSNRWEILSPPTANLPTPESTNMPGDTATAVMGSVPAPSKLFGKTIASPFTFGAAKPQTLIGESPASIQATTVSSEAVVAEPSMLQRFKGLYEPATENAARKIFKKPFTRLSNPWTAVFGEKEAPDDSAATALEQTPQTADVSASPDEETLAPATGIPLLGQLIDATLNELNGWPRKPDGTPINLQQYQRRQVDLRLLYLVADQPGSAVQAIDELPAAEQNFWQELMLAMAEYRSQNGETVEERMTSTTTQLRSAVRQLTPLAALRIRRFEICSRIHSFGRVDPFQSDKVDPGQPLLLYAEVENFTTELTPAGNHRTQFEAELKLYEEGNTKPKETISLPNISDEATSERSDYYQSFELSLPSHLKSGQYFIRLRLRDRVSGKTAESTVEFQVRQPETAQLSNAL